MIIAVMNDVITDNHLMEVLLSTTVKQTDLILRHTFTFLNSMTDSSYFLYLSNLFQSMQSDKDELYNLRRIQAGVGSI